MPFAPSLRAIACVSLLLAAGTASAQTTQELRVAASLDDVEQFADSSIYVNSSDLELIHDTSDQIVGMRWVGLAVPPGSTITAAWIQFSAKESQSEVTNLNFRAQAADAAPAFTTGRNNVGARPRTSSVVTWSPVAWNAGEIGANQRTPDLKSIIQEVVSRPGWAINSPLVIIVDGTGHRTTWAWDGNALQAPLLHVEYTSGTPPPDLPPVAALSVTQSASSPLTILASAAGSADSDATPIASYSFDWGDGTAATLVNAPVQSTQHTYASAGPYTVTLSVKDTGGLTSAPKTQSITMAAPPVVTTVESRVAASSDDAEQRVSTASVNLTSSDLELIQDSQDQIVGMRWPRLAIPQGATITAAWIQFVSKEAWSVATNLTIKAQAVDNAATFTSASNNVSSRPVTSASVSWAPVAWAVGDAGANQRTPDLSALVQEVVSRPAWASGNALAIIVSGSGHRTAWAFDGSGTRAPLIHVEYASGGTPPPASGNVAVYVGYYDTHHPGLTRPKPSPWQGAAGVTFVGKDDDGKGNWDTSALRVDNLTGSSMTVTVTCDIGSNNFSLWGSRTVPANGTLILAQTAFQNFDGSDTSPAGCFGCDPSLCLTKVVSTIPVVHVTVGGTTTNYYDNTQVLNTRGADGAGCPYTGDRNDESQQWKQVGTTKSEVEGSDDRNGDVVPTRMTFDAPAPNPVKGWVAFRFALPTASRAFVGLYDVAGRLVRTVLDRDMPAGIFQRGVNLSDVRPGVYYCLLQTPYGNARRTVVVSR